MSVENAISAFGGGEGNAVGRRWFRGQANAEWDLRPSVLRPSVQAALTRRGGWPMPPGLSEYTQALRAEADLNREFRRRVSSMVTRLDAVELYLLAQHQRLPTRLLDWTTNLLAALFFACVERPDVDGRLFAISPTFGVYPGPNGGVVESTTNTYHPDIRRLIESLFSDEPDLTQYGWQGVIPLVPDLQAGRMSQQGACFTLHLPNAESVPLEAPTSVVISRERKSAFRETLHRIGVSWGTLFPEPEFVARDLEYEFGLST